MLDYIHRVMLDNLRVCDLQPLKCSTRKEGQYDSLMLSAQERAKGKQIF